MAPHEFTHVREHPREAPGPYSPQPPQKLPRLSSTLCLAQQDLEMGKSLAPAPPNLELPNAPPETARQPQPEPVSSPEAVLLESAQESARETCEPVLEADVPRPSGHTSGTCPSSRPVEASAHPQSFPCHDVPNETLHARELQLDSPRVQLRERPRVKLREKAREIPGEDRLPDILCSFYYWMRGAKGKSEGTSRNYVRNIIKLYREDSLSPLEMATQRYLNVHRGSPEDRSCHGQRSGAVRFFIQWWEECRFYPLRSAGNEVMFRVDRTPCAGARLAADGFTLGQRVSVRGGKEVCDWNLGTVICLEPLEVMANGQEKSLAWRTMLAEEENSTTAPPQEPGDGRGRTAGVGGGRRSRPSLRALALAAAVVAPPAAPVRSMSPDAESIAAAHISREAIRHDAMLLWTVDRVEAFFESLGLGQYCLAVRENCVDGGTLRELVDLDGLEDLGIASKLNRAKILAGLWRPTVQGADLTAVPVEANSTATATMRESPEPIAAGASGGGAPGGGGAKAKEQGESRERRGSGEGVGLDHKRDCGVGVEERSWEPKCGDGGTKRRTFHVGGKIGRANFWGRSGHLWGRSNVLALEKARPKGCHRPGCMKWPCFNFPGKRDGASCLRHKLEGMVDVKHRTCERESCVKQPSFNMPGEKRGRFCAEHKHEGMINVRCPAPR